MNASRRVCLSFACIIVLFGAHRAAAQVSLTSLGTPATQPFDTLATSGTANPWADNTTLTGWYAQFAATANPATYRADSGGSNAGAIYSWGVLGANALTERAFGSIGSGGTGTVHYGVRLVNNTGATITSLDVSFVGEQWRQGGCSAACPSGAAAQTVDFQYQVANAGVITDANVPATGWTDLNTLDFTSPNPGTATAAAIEGNLAGNRTALSSTITVTVSPGQEVWFRWVDINHPDNDHGLAIDQFSVTPQGGGNAPVVPTCPATLTTTFGTATSSGVSATDSDGTVTSATITGITPADPGTITLTGFTPAGGVGGTANATLDVSNTTPAGSYSVTIQWANNDGTPQTANCVVAVTVNAPPTVVFIHQVQGNGAATPMPGATVTIEGIVIGDYQPVPNDVRLNGFFVQEEDTDASAEGDPTTSEGIFIFCSGCPTNVAEGQRVQVTGVVSEFNGMTEITATTAGSVVITDAGNNLALVTPTAINLPIVAPNINDFYEQMENMLVTYSDTLTISEYFEQARYGRIELFEGGRPRQYTEDNAPNAAGYAAHLDNLTRRRVYLDDDDSVENSPLLLPEGSQFVYYPRANGGLSVGTQGPDFFRGGDQISGLTGVLHWSRSGPTGAGNIDEWRIRPTSATPSAVTVVNPRPATPPAVGGAIRVAAANVLNYFTTLDVRGADSTAELNRQRERTSIVLCALDADVAALMEIENGNTAIADLLADVNTRCGGANPYTFVNTGGAIGTDQIRVILIYRTGVVSPVGAPIVDLDPVHNRPPTAQTFDVVDATNPAFGQRFTAVANHSKSKGCGGAAGADLDQNDGQSCFAATRLAQHNRIVTWVNGTVVPAAGDPDVLLLGDFNSYEQETPMTALYGAGYTDLENLFLGSNAYSYLFDGQLGHLDYALSSASLTPQITGANVWHINADENPLFDYNDEIDDGSAEQAFEEKPDGSALVPPRVLFQPATAVRASDHDPVLLGIFAISDLVLTKTDSPDPVTAGNNLTYTITVTNNGPDSSTGASWTDTLPADTTFVSMPANTGVGGWTCTTPAVGATGMISCTNPNFSVGSSVFTLTVAVAPNVPAGNVISNTAQVTDATTEGNPGDESDTEVTTVAASSDLSVSKSDSPDPVNAGNNITYTITVNNPGPSNAAGVSLNDTVPANTTFVSLASPGGWSCTTPALGGTGNVNCTNPSLGLGNAVFTLVVNVNANTAAGTIITNSATSASTTDTNVANDTGTATTTVATSADLTVTKTDSPDPVTAGTNLTYTITVNNAGPSNAATVDLTDNVPGGTTFVSMTAPGGWSCVTPAVGGTGLITCSNPSVGLGNAVFTMVVNTNPSLLDGSNLTNTAQVTSTTTDPATGGESDTETTTVATSADLSVTKVDTPDPVTAGTNLTYTITLNNAGPSAAEPVTLTDTVPANTTFVSFTAPAGWSCSTPPVGGTGLISCNNPLIGLGDQVFTLVVNVNPGTTNGTIITNTATAASGAADPTTPNNGTATTTVGLGSADLSVTKTDTPDPVSAGSNITYTITATNAGPSNATTATLADTVPANTTFVSFTAPAGWSCTTPPAGGTGNINCSIPSMDIGSDVFTLTVNVNPATLGGTIITNSVTVGSATTDPDPDSSDLTDTETTTVAPGSADLSVTKTDTPDPVNSGSNITYTINVTNAGPTNAAAATLADTVPANTTFVSLAVPAGWLCTTPAAGATGAINCTATTVDVGTDVFTLVVNVTAGTAPNTVITNNVTVASATADPDPDSTDLTDTETTTVLSPATVSGTKTAAGAFTPGSTVTYTIVLSNSGPSTQTNNPGDELVDVLPASLTLVSANATSGTAVATVPTNTVTWNGAIQAGGTVTITITALIDTDAAPGTTVTNQATINFDADGNGTNESSAATDDPNTVGGGNPTPFIVASPANVAGVPALDGFGLAMLAALLAGLGLLVMRRT
ncbi:MAG TPA: ExeM/NucH family extracellular endonuclease [Thermoanaerobaculia bacterium]|nr:ExeM/NucH family extracellular endonuclease [Thermoanaerobaculia bacterium]